MVDECQNAGVILMEAFMWRHQPRTLSIREMVRRGDIGELRLIRSSFSFPIAADDWRLDRLRGGGALWDVGCYGVNAARFFTGQEPSLIQSLARFGPTGVDMSLTASLEFPSGVLAAIDCSFEQPFRCHYELSGTRGLIDVPLAYLPVRWLEAGGRSHSDQLGQECRQSSATIDAPGIRAGRPICGDGRPLRPLCLRR